MEERERTPHWPSGPTTDPAAVAEVEVRRTAAYPREHPVGPADMATTIYEAPGSTRSWRCGTGSAGRTGMPIRAALA